MAASRGNPCSLSLRLNCLCQGKRMGLTIFIPFSCSCGSGVASSHACWSPRGSTAGSLLGAFSELIRHFTPLASPFHPSAWLHSCLSGSFCLCAVQTLSHLSILSLSVGGSLVDLKFVVGERIGRAGYLAFLPRRHTFSGIFC